METLERSKMYRIAHNASKKEIRGVAVYFLEYVERGFDIRRAKIRVVGTQETYLVSPSLLIKF
jgi:hypothetical protein